MPVTETNERREEAAKLFKDCRHALGLTVNQMQDALCVLNRLTILRIEEKEIDIQGPTWVALWHLLDADLADNKGDNKRLNQLMDQIESFMNDIKQLVQRRRDKAYGPREGREEAQPE
jgi:hypothetical protein